MLEEMKVVTMVEEMAGSLVASMAAMSVCMMAEWKIERTVDY